MALRRAPPGSWCVGTSSRRGAAPPRALTARAGPSAGPREAVLATEGRAAPLSVDDPDLAVLAALVRLRQPLDDLLGGQPLAEQREPLGAVARIRPRLRGDRAHVRLRPRDERADGEELRLHRDAPLAAAEVATDDRVRAVRHLDEVEVEELAGALRHDDARHLRPAEGAQHLVGGTGTDDHGPAFVVRRPERLDVVDALEDERVLVHRNGGISFDGDLRDAAPGGAEPALPHTVTVSPGSTACTLTWGASCCSSSGVPWSSGKVP